jgi:hypothetical protein
LRSILCLTASQLSALPHFPAPCYCTSRSGCRELRKHVRHAPYGAILRVALPLWRCPSCALPLNTLAASIRGRTYLFRRVNRASEDSSSAPCYSSLSLADRRAPCMQSLDAPDTAILLSSDRILELFHSSIWPQYRYPTVPAINCTQQFAHPAELSSKTGASRRHTYYASR